MAGMYCMDDLLNLVLRESAEELRLQVGEPPVMVLRGEPLAIDVAAVTRDNVTELFQCLATENQLKELHACGQVQFIHLFQNSARFSVTARVQHEAFDVNIKNLSR
jgi:Tfp pilus assembly pilus retraction ATPase PilT